MIDGRKFCGIPVEEKIGPAAISLMDAKGDTVIVSTDKALMTP